VSWRLPVASKAEGIYIDLQDGRRLIDAVGTTVSSIISTMIRISEPQVVLPWLASGMAIRL